MGILYMDVFVPVVCMVIVTVMWFLHKKKKQNLLNGNPYQNRKKENMRNGKKELKLQQLQG